MKLNINLKLYLLAIIICIGSISANASSITTEPIATDTTEVVNMLRRLDNIYRMDKSNLKKDKKKELRNEVRAIKGKLKASNNGGIYISGGAVLVIIILLIILL